MTDDAMIRPATAPPFPAMAAAKNRITILSKVAIQFFIFKPLSNYMDT